MKPMPGIYERWMKVLKWPFYSALLLNLLVWPFALYQASELSSQREAIFDLTAESCDHIDESLKFEELPQEERKRIQDEAHECRMQFRPLHDKVHDKEDDLQLAVNTVVAVGFVGLLSLLAMGVSALLHYIFVGPKKA